mmetsp:Transcript_18324/g.24479  ORF Transcript_18324/g.24479 Transcript_18324/m.24479 type:complete len:165 (+) Transcript_18324:400-894(+)
MRDQNNYSHNVQSYNYNTDQAQNALRASSDLSKMMMTQEGNEIIQRMKKTGVSLGGHQNNFVHASLIAPGNVPKADPNKFLSPQAQRHKNIIAHDFADGTEQTKKGRNMFSTLSPGAKQANAHVIGRNNSMVVGSDSTSILSPITHSPMHLIREGGANTARASN